MLKDVTKATRELTEKFGEDNEGYPLESRKSKANFRALLVSFVKSLSSRCRDSIFQDEYILETAVR